jgi:peroxiredoxin Q/BCP
MTIQVGDKAPDFTLPSQSGEPVTLNSFEGKWVVLYFYPKDDTPGCTAESCAFRDNYDVFREAGAEVIGISGDSPDSHQKFAARYNLPFTLVSDTNNQVRKAFGVPNAMLFLPGRVTYVIDPEGIVRHSFNSMMDFKAHVDEALKVLRQSRQSTLN